MLKINQTSEESTLIMNYISMVIVWENILMKISLLLIPFAGIY
jgi:hypothetical protein